MFLDHHAKVPVILVIFYANLNFFDRFSEKKNPDISNFITIHAVAAELFHADSRHTDGKTQRRNSRFSQFCKGAYKPRTVCQIHTSIIGVPYLFRVHSITVAICFLCKQRNHKLRYSHVSVFSSKPPVLLYFRDSIKSLP